MRLIRPAGHVSSSPWALALALAMLVVGGTALALMAFVPGGRLPAVGPLGVSAALGIGVGLAWMTRALSDRRRRPGDQLARLLAPAFDDTYVLIVAPRLPDVPPDLAALLVGPPGIRVLLEREWRGRYRVRGRSWEYDTKGSAGWIGCRTNPSFDADAVVDAVARWARVASDEAALPIGAAVVFPNPWSVVVLEEPDGEVVTADNAPWWAQRIGRVQRMDGQRIARFVEAVIDAADRAAVRATAQPRQA
jgi:hypothetical protein